MMHKMHPDQNRGSKKM